MGTHLGTSAKLPRSTGHSRTVLRVRLESWPWRTVIRSIGVVAIAVAALVFVIALLGPITDLIARHDVGALPALQRAAHLQAARETARTQLLTLGAGLFAAGALVYTARNFTLSREGQVTDRYTKAIEQLGSDELDVRIGGIYALERVARDSARDHPTVMEVLTAFVRGHSREPWPPAAGDEPGAAAPERLARPDVQAAVAVIGRRNVRHDRQPVNLAGAFLSGAFLPRANLDGAVLVGADLARANLYRAHLAFAFLDGADLRGANLGYAHLDGADFTGANLGGADLTGADLRGARMETDWVPKGWQPDARSGRLKRADTSSGGTATN
jgi:Pentapeptide repeats (8 copies)